MALLDDLRGKGGSVLEEDDSRVETVPFDALALDENPGPNAFCGALLISERRRK